jgi:hypothetical protein
MREHARCSTSTGPLYLKSASAPADNRSEVPMRTSLLLASLVLVAGCWAGAQIRYRDHPELVNVKLATGNQKWEPPHELGVVQAYRSGYRSCDALVADAFRDLLAESHALGGSGVEEVKFRQRWHWSGKAPLCRRHVLVFPFMKSVRVQGVAVR